MIDNDSIAADDSARAPHIFDHDRDTKGVLTLTMVHSEEGWYGHVERMLPEVDHVTDYRATKIEASRLAHEFIKANGLPAPMLLRDIK